MVPQQRFVTVLCVFVAAAAGVSDITASLGVAGHDAEGGAASLNQLHVEGGEPPTAAAQAASHPKDVSHLGKADVAALELAAIELDGGDGRDAGAATTPQSMVLKSKREGKVKAKAKAKSSEESTWLWIGMLFVACFYLIIWRAFNLASEGEKVLLFPPRPTTGGGAAQAPEALPNPAPTASASPLPVISSKLVSVTRDFPLAIPLDALSQGPVWSINVTGCTGVPLLNAVRRVRDPSDVSQGDISILDCGSRAYLAGATSELQIFDGQNRAFGQLEQHETNTQYGTRFILREANGQRTRICFDYAHDTGDVGVLCLPQGARVAMLLRKVGTFGSRRGNFLELMIHPGADAVLITACVLCILNFVPPPDRLPQKTGYAGPMGETVNGALSEM